MTREEVIEILQSVKHMITIEKYNDEVEEALNLAIETVEKEDKRVGLLIHQTAIISALEEESKKLAHVQLLPTGTLIVSTRLFSQVQRVRVKYEGEGAMFYSLREREVIHANGDDIDELPTADVVSKEKYDELNDRYHRLLESANILADAVRDYERRDDE